MYYNFCAILPLFHIICTNNVDTKKAQTSSISPVRLSTAPYILWIEVYAYAYTPNGCKVLLVVLVVRC